MYVKCVMKDMKLIYIHIIKIMKNMYEKKWKSIVYFRRFEYNYV